jgi:hypothetical protein
MTRSSISALVRMFAVYLMLTAMIDLIGALGQYMTSGGGNFSGMGNIPGFGNIFMTGLMPSLVQIVVGAIVLGSSKALTEVIAGPTQE